MCRRDTAASGEAAARDEGRPRDRFRKHCVALHDARGEFLASGEVVVSSRAPVKFVLCLLA